MSGGDRKLTAAGFKLVEPTRITFFFGRGPKFSLYFVFPSASVHATGREVAITAHPASV